MGLTGPFISTYHLVVLRHVSDLVDGDEVDDAVGIQLLGFGHRKVLLVLVGLSGMNSVRRRAVTLQWGCVVPFWRERWCPRRGCTRTTPPWPNTRPRGWSPHAWLPPPAPGSHDSPLPEVQQGRVSKINQFFFSQYLLLPFPCKVFWKWKWLLIIMTNDYIKLSNMIFFRCTIELCLLLLVIT